MKLKIVYLIALLIIVVVYYCYRNLSPEKPYVIYNKRSETAQQLVKLLEPALNVPFKSAWFLPNGILHSYYSASFKRPSPKNDYERKMIVDEDGEGEYALDFAKVNDDLGRNAPIIIILHGLVGGSREQYIQRAVRYAVEKGFRPVVLTNRGCAGTKIKSPRIYCCTDTRDLRKSLKMLHEEYPYAKIIIVGFSMGGMILNQAIVQAGKENTETGTDFMKECNVVGGIAISPTWLPCETMKNILPYFMKIFATGLAKLIAKNEDFVKKCKEEGKIPAEVNIDAAKNAKTVPDFDHNFTAPMNGYNSGKAYYHEIEKAIARFALVKVPYVTLSALNDPIACDMHITTPRLEDVSEFTSHVVNLVTKNGGHLGWCEGGNKWEGIKEPSYLERIIVEFSNAFMEFSENPKID